MYIYIVHILKTSRNGDNKWINPKNEEVEPVQPVQMNTNHKAIPVGYIPTTCQGFTTNSPAYLFLQLIEHIQIAVRGTSPEMTTVFHARPL